MPELLLLCVRQNLITTLFSLWLCIQMNAADTVSAEHSYVRTCALRRGACTPDGTGPVYIVDGTAGAYTGGGNQGRSCTQPKPPFTDKAVLAKDCMWGWSTLSVNATTLEWVHKRWDTGDVSDSLKLSKA